MEQVEETLPGIGIFLKEFLAREELTPLAEKMRQYYLDKMEQPPASEASKQTGVERRKGSSQRRFKTNSLIDFRDSKSTLNDSPKNNKKRASYTEIKEFKSDEKLDIASQESGITPKRDSARASGREIERVDHVGVLYKRKKLTWKKFHCMLANRVFLYFDTERCVGKEVDIEEYCISVTTREGLRYPQEIKMSAPQLKTFVFYAENKATSNKWVQEFEKQVDFEHKKTSLSVSSDALSPNQKKSNNQETNSLVDISFNQKSSKKKIKKRYKIQNFINMMKDKIVSDNETHNNIQVGAIYDEINVAHFSQPALPTSPPPMSPSTYETLNFVENSYMDPVDCITNYSPMNKQGKCGIKESEEKAKRFNLHETKTDQVTDANNKYTYSKVNNKLVESENDKKDTPAPAILTDLHSVNKVTSTSEMRNSFLTSKENQQKPSWSTSQLNDQSNTVSNSTKTRLSDIQHKPLLSSSQISDQVKVVSSPAKTCSADVQNKPTLSTSQMNDQIRGASSLVVQHKPPLSTSKVKDLINSDTVSVNKNSTVGNHISRLSTAQVNNETNTSKNIVKDNSFRVINKNQLSDKTDNKLNNLSSNSEKKTSIVLEKIQIFENSKSK